MTVDSVTKIRDILGPSIDQVFRNNRGNLIIRRCKFKNDTMTCEHYVNGIQNLLNSNGVNTTVVSSKFDEDGMLGKHYVTELSQTNKD
jgi:hypothetical protein